MRKAFVAFADLLGATRQLKTFWTAITFLLGLLVFLYGWPENALKIIGFLSEASVRPVLRLMFFALLVAVLAAAVVLAQLLRRVNLEDEARRRDAEAVRLDASIQSVRRALAPQLERLDKNLSLTARALLLSRELENLANIAHRHEKQSQSIVSAVQAGKAFDDYTWRHCLMTISMIYGQSIAIGALLGMEMQLSGHGDDSAPGETGLPHGRQADYRAFWNQFKARERNLTALREAMEHERKIAWEGLSRS